MKLVTVDHFQGKVVNHHVRCFEKNKQEISVLIKHHVDLDDCVFECICDTLPSTDELNDLLLP